MTLTVDPLVHLSSSWPLALTPARPLGISSFHFQECAAVSAAVRCRP